MSKFIEVKNDDYNTIIDLEKIASIVVYIEHHSRDRKSYFVEFRMSYDLVYRHKCNSELEAQMIYAKIRKKLCTDEELNEILWVIGLKLKKRMMSLDIQI